MGSSGRIEWGSGIASIVFVLASGGVWADPAEPRGNDTENVIVEGRRERSSVILDQPVVTGSRLDIDARELPASVSVVSQELISRRGARTAVEAIGAAVGMMGGTSVGSIPNYSTRGFSGNDITVMQDGIRQNTASQSSRPIDPFLLERIEVLKGPASLLYGEGAIGGAVNYVSKRPSSEWHGDVLVEIGEWNAQRLGFGVGGPTGIEDVSFRADVIRSTGDGYVDNSGSEYDGATGSLQWDLTDETRISVSGVYRTDDIRSYYGTPILYDAVIDDRGQTMVTRAVTGTDRLVNARIDERLRRLNYNTADNVSQSRNTFWRATLETSLNYAWSLRNLTYLATQDMEWRNTESTVWNPATQRVDRSSNFLIYRDDEQWGNQVDLIWRGELAGMENQLVVGVLYDDNDQIRNSGQNNFPNAPTPASVPLFGFEEGLSPTTPFQATVRVGTQTTAAYFENVFEPIQDLKIVSGLRYEQIDVERRSLLGAPTFTKQYDPITGRLGALYALTPSVNVYASYSRAAQPVAQLVSLGASQAEFGLQKGRQIEAGVKASLFDQRADFTLALFDIEKNDLLTSQRVDDVIALSQVGAQLSQGAEVATAIQATRWLSVDANVAWTWKAEYEDFLENVTVNRAGQSARTLLLSRDGNTPPNVAEWVAGLFVSANFDVWTASAGARYVSEREANNNNGIQLDAYTTVDASVSYRWSDLIVTLRGRNLTNATYAEWASAGGLMVRLAEPRTADVSFTYAF